MGAFYVMEVGLPGKAKCPDDFEEIGPAVLICAESHVLTAQIAANAVYVQFGIMPPHVGRSQSVGDVIWQQPRSWLPTAFSIPRRFDAVRVRNFTKGAEAQVSLEAY